MLDLEAALIEPTDAGEHPVALEALACRLDTSAEEIRRLPGSTSDALSSLNIPIQPPEK